MFQFFEHTYNGYLEAFVYKNLASAHSHMQLLPPMHRLYFSVCLPGLQFFAGNRLWRIAVCTDPSHPNVLFLFAVHLFCDWMGYFSEVTLPTKMLLVQFGDDSVFCNFFISFLKCT